MYLAMAEHFNDQKMTSNGWISGLKVVIGDIWQIEIAANF